MILRKDQLEKSLHDEKKLIETGKLKDENPLDKTPIFVQLCGAARSGDLKTCQEAINNGANINARDQFDYTPLILASLCGHYEVVELLLEHGALCERDTFQGERCLYNALNDRIRNLLLAYDFSKSTDPLQPLASHITSLLTREIPKTSDILVSYADRSFQLHKFILAARSPYFQKKLSTAISFKLPSHLPPRSFEIAIRYLYLSELPNDIGGGPGTGFSDKDVLEGLDKISRHLEIPTLWEGILEAHDRRLTRQRRSEEVEKAQLQLDSWFKRHVLEQKVNVDFDKADTVRWDRHNAIFADVLLRADDDALTGEIAGDEDASAEVDESTPNGNIPVGPISTAFSNNRDARKSTLYPVHRAMLLRSEFFQAMFSSSFLEAQETPHLQIIPVEASPEVLEAVLRYIYTEKSDFTLDIALSVLFAADLLLMDRLKTKAAMVVSTLGNGQLPKLSSSTTSDQYLEEAENSEQVNPVDPFQILNAAWLLRVPRLEEFAARYLAYRLEHYIDLPEFADAVRESARRIRNRQETDSIELIDDIRHYLSERFRLRFEGEGLEMFAEADESDATTAVEDLTSVDASTAKLQSLQLEHVGVIRTLDGDIAGDEFAKDEADYRILVDKIDDLLETLDLDG